MHDSELFEIRKRYCPAKKKNVAVKLFYGDRGEECTERADCDLRGGCINAYLRTENPTRNI